MSNGLASQLDTATRQPVVQDSTNKSAHVLMGFVGQARNRNINAAATTYATATNTVTWPATVKEVSIQVPATATLSYVLVVYDAPSTAAADAWLADVGAAAVDVAYDLIQAGQTLTRQFSAGITRIDVLPVGAATRIVIGAV